jgi:hypothetical protein
MQWIDVNCRLYFNKSADAEKAWSLDFGPGTTELLLERVELETVSGETGTELSQTNSERPKAWIQFANVEVDLDEESRVATIRGVERA